jgi:archaellum component FlaC
MQDLSRISALLRGVLGDLERVTDDIEAIQTQVDSVANDAFPIRTTARPEDDR